MTEMPQNDDILKNVLILKINYFSYFEQTLTHFNEI
jgi:hypothetical protein